MCSAKNKNQLARAYWRDQQIVNGLSEGSEAMVAYEWLCEHNNTYKQFITMHNDVLKNPAKSELMCNDDLGRLWIPTAKLLLRMPGVEVAIRPWLYPSPAHGDTDHKERLVELGWLQTRNLPSTTDSYMRKIKSSCVDYQEDFDLVCLLNDIVLAKRLTAIVNKAHDDTHTHTHTHTV